MSEKPANPLGPNPVYKEVFDNARSENSESAFGKTRAKLMQSRDGLRKERDPQADEVFQRTNRLLGELSVNENTNVSETLQTLLVLSYFNPPR